jgi:hypothetical protein
MTTQKLAVTQKLADAKANTSRVAWLMTGHYACYLLAEARPTPQQLGEFRFESILLRSRATRARELVAARSAVAEAWDAIERSVSGEPTRYDDGR